ncbi:hypothetical protein [Vibrio alginolyticus]|uniref:hypothetical protein n=1 Tax=Vibrio TaxID=662 RepID=UPI0006CA71A7|nr:hypothetical protein [Vibrio alginolyticus]KPM98426.1 hypothetical protein AOG25_08245 [Vibrio alginolyticus]
MNLLKISDLLAKQGVNLVNKADLPLMETIEFHVLDIPFSLVIKEEEDGGLLFETTSPVLYSGGNWSLIGKTRTGTVLHQVSGAYSCAVDDRNFNAATKNHTKRAAHILCAMIGEFLDDLEANTELADNILERTKAFENRIDEENRIQKERERQEAEAAKIEFEQNFKYMPKSKVAQLLSEAKKQSIDTRSEVVAEFIVVNHKTYKTLPARVTFNPDGKPRFGACTVLKDIKFHLERAVEPN